MLMPSPCSKMPNGRVIPKNNVASFTNLSSRTEALHQDMQSSLLSLYLVLLTICLTSVIHFAQFFFCSFILTTPKN